MSPSPLGKRLPELRLVLAVSIDGRLAPAAGGAAQLGGAGDRGVLEEALAWADGCLIGAETLRLHGSTCLIHRTDLLAQRRQLGRPAQPVALVVSGSGLIPPELPFFHQPIARWLLTKAAVDPTLAQGFAQVRPLNPWPELLAALAEAGLGRLLVLGGARLAGSLLADQLIDELQLTVCPQLLGGPHGWLPWRQTQVESRWQLLEQRPLEGDELMLRYGRF